MHEEDWERGSVPLKFQLGDVVLGKAALSLLRRSARIDERPLEVGEIPAPPPRLDGVDGYVVWSQPIARLLPVLGARRDPIVYVPRQYRRFSVDLSGSFEQYMATFSSKTRSGLRRKFRKFSEASGGNVVWKAYRTPEQVAQFFPLAKQVSAKSYQERYLRIGLPDDQSFVDSALELAGRDELRAYLLYLDGKPISYLYCPVRQRSVMYDHLGYDPAYAPLSPGTVLQILALEALFAEQRFIMFDFTEGEGQHKEVFSTGSSLCGDIYVVNRRLMPLLLVHQASERTSAVAGKILDRLKLKSRLRRVLRSI